MYRGRGTGGKVIKSLSPFFFVDSCSTLDENDIYVIPLGLTMVIELLLPRRAGLIS